MNVSKQVGVLSFFVFAITFSIFIDNFSVVTTSARPNKERGAWGAFDQWYAQRALPYEMIPQQAFQQAAIYNKTTFKKEQTAREVNSFETDWISLGPVNIGGRILSIAIDPTNTDIIWAGSASGGLWKSTTAGVGSTAWSYINTGYPTISVSSVVLDPSNPDIMYIGTGEISRYQRPLVGTPGARASYGMGILKSTDGGTTWNTTGLTYTFPQITAIQKIVINPLNTNTLFAATSEGTYKSTNSGASWTQSHSVLMAMDIVMHPTDTTILYVSYGNLNSSLNPGIYFTQDAGDSWIQLKNGLPSSNFGRTALSIAPSNPSIIYAGVSNGSSASIIGLYKTTNGGVTWLQTSATNYVGSQGWYNNVVAVHPTDPNRVFCSGLDIHRSTNGGTSLPAVSPSSVHVDHHAIAFDPNNPNIIYFGCDGGMFKSNDGGDVYTNINGGLVTTQFYPGFANAALDTNLALGGLQDNGTIRYVGNNSWQTVFGGDGGWCAIDPTNSSIMYYEFQYLQLYKSTNGGGNAFPIMTGLPTGSGNTNFIPPFIISPSSPNILYAGNKYVYKTTNGGTSWFSPSGATSFNGTPVACIGVSWTSPDTLIAATGTGTLGATPIFEVFASTNGGQTWTNVTTSLPNRYPTDIEFDPTNSSIVYMTYSGYGTSHVFRSTNAGLTWVNITANLPDIPHQAIVVDPEYPEHLYLGTDLGVYRSTNSGITWTDYNIGMPQAMVLDLTISRPNNALRAATFGNGIYQRKLARVPVLSVTSPNGGEVHVSSQPATISWSYKFLDFLRLEYSTNNGVSWNLIEDNVPATQASYVWTIPDFGTTQARVRVSDAVSNQAIDSSDNVFTILHNPTVLGGWNLVSIDKIVPDPLKSSIFPSAISSAFDYANGYNEKDSLDHGIGYWLKFPEPEFIDLMGDSLHSDTISIKSGWNMIGSIAKLINTSDIIQNPPDIVMSQFFGYRNGYSADDTLYPKRGYWVRASGDGTLLLPHLVRQVAQSKPSTNKLSYSTIRIIDAKGNRQELYITSGNSLTELNRFEMPPLPPAGIFDSRFTSGRMLETISQSSGKTTNHSISIRNAVYPLTIEWETEQYREGQLYIEAGGKRTMMDGNGSIDIKNSSIVAVGITTAIPPDIPLEFSLEQNYPNPFNPSTTIRYSLPEQSHVTVKVFDILGKEITMLVNEVQGAGLKSITWDAGLHPSGVYFYNVETSKQAATRKMLLIK